MASSSSCLSVPIGPQSFSQSICRKLQTCAQLCAPPSSHVTESTASCSEGHQLHECISNGVFLQTQTTETPCCSCLRHQLGFTCSHDHLSRREHNQMLRCAAILSLKAVRLRLEGSTHHVNCTLGADWTAVFSPRFSKGSCVTLACPMHTPGSRPPILGMDSRSDVRCFGM